MLCAPQGDKSTTPKTKRTREQGSRARGGPGRTEGRWRGEEEASGGRRLVRREGQGPSDRSDLDGSSLGLRKGPRSPAPFPPPHRQMLR